TQSQNRTFLIESVKWSDVNTLLASLDSQSQHLMASRTNAGPPALLARSALLRRLPSVPPRHAEQSTNAIQLSSLTARGPAILWDYETLAGGTDTHLQKNKTYRARSGET